MPKMNRRGGDPVAWADMTLSKSKFVFPGPHSVDSSEGGSVFSIPDLHLRCFFDTCCFSRHNCSL